LQSTQVERQKKQLVQEVNILGALDHMHIVEYHTRIIDRKTRCIYLVQEFCELGDLAGYLREQSKTCDEEFVWQVMLEITSCLEYCHNHKQGKILHRDLKPQNIFLTRVGEKIRCKLGDFGVSKALQMEGMTATKVGTPAYASPEQMSGGNYNEASDIWSLGCVLYEMCMGKPPFGPCDNNIMHHRRTSTRVRPLTGGYSKRLNQVLMQMLKVNPMQRPTTSEILLLPRHWLQFRSPNQQKHQRRHKKLLAKMEQWKNSNLKQAQLEKAMKQRDDRKTRDLKRKKSKHEMIRNNLKSHLDEVIMRRLLELEISALERREVLTILRSLRLANYESPRTNSNSLKSSETSSNTTTDSFEQAIEIDSFDWSLSPLGTFSSGINSTKEESLDAMTSFETQSNSKSS